MVITQQNNRLYDTRNFDSYKNYYVIHYNEEKYNTLKLKNSADSYTVYMNYVRLSTELILSVDYNVEQSENIYRIIYGHFYNNEDKFLFKKVHDGKIIGYKVSRCNKGELWHNKLNQLYIANYFKDAKKTAILLNNEANIQIADETINPVLSYITHSDETLIFNNSWDSEYSQDEILTINIEQPYIIEYKQINLN